MAESNPNRAGCIDCGSVITSCSVHDFVSCRCGKIAVDGGQDYFKRVFVDNMPVELPTQSDVDKFRAAYPETE